MFFPSDYHRRLFSGHVKWLVIYITFSSTSFLSWVPYLVTVPDWKTFPTCILVFSFVTFLDNWSCLTNWLGISVQRTFRHTLDVGPNLHCYILLSSHSPNMYVTPAVHTAGSIGPLALATHDLLEYLPNTLHSAFSVQNASLSFCTSSLSSLIFCQH